MGEFIKQSPPFCVQVELTEGCNLFCDFCGLKGIRERPNLNLKFMEPETAIKIAVAIADCKTWNPRIEFAMHGEPSLNPRLCEILAIFRGTLPNASLMMTSNGGGISRHEDIVKRVDDLLKSGLNILAIDCYAYARGTWRPIEKALDAAGFPFAWYPENKDANPHQRAHPSIGRVVFVKDISLATKGTHASLNTHCGAGSPPKVIMEPCGKPFRELSFRWDGAVALCCNDWRGEFKISNIHDVESIEQIWQHDFFLAARRHLLEGLRTFTPCNKCDARTYRPGLLPDQRGKEMLDTPSIQDRKFIEEATAGDVLTQPVIRPWEEGFEK